MAFVHSSLGFVGVVKSQSESSRPVRAPIKVAEAVTIDGIPLPGLAVGLDPAKGSDKTKAIVGKIDPHDTLVLIGATEDVDRLRLTLDASVPRFGDCTGFALDNVFNVKRLEVSIGPSGSRTEDGVVKLSGPEESLRAISAAVTKMLAKCDHSMQIDVSFGGAQRIRIHRDHSKDAVFSREGGGWDAKPSSTESDARWPTFDGIPIHAHTVTSDTSSGSRRITLRGTGDQALGDLLRAMKRGEPGTLVLPGRQDAIRVFPSSWSVGANFVATFDDAAEIVYGNARATLHAIASGVPAPQNTEPCYRCPKCRAIARFFPSSSPMATLAESMFRCTVCKTESKGEELIRLVEEKKPAADPKAEIDAVLREDARRYPAFATARRCAVMAACEWAAREWAEVSEEPCPFAAADARLVLAACRSYEARRGVMKAPSEKAIAWSLESYTASLDAYERARGLR